MPRKIPMHRPPSLSVPEARPNSAARGYDHSWRRYRVWFLRRNPLCVQCGQPAAHVDHIVPVVNGQAHPLFWEYTNHQALCPSCHNQKTARMGSNVRATTEMGSSLPTTPPPGGG
jgi:5-methylcytosine-specific restriction protein A